MHTFDSTCEGISLKLTSLVSFSANWPIKEKKVCLLWAELCSSEIHMLKSQPPSISECDYLEMGCFVFSCSGYILNMEHFTNLHVILAQGPCYHSNFNIHTAKVSMEIWGLKEVLGQNRIISMSSNLMTGLLVRRY